MKNSSHVSFFISGLIFSIIPIAVCLYFPLTGRAGAVTVLTYRKLSKSRYLRI